jgi:hypothetical protein
MNTIPNARWNGLESVTGSMTKEQKDLLDVVRCRLENAIRQDIYLSEMEFAKLILIDQKTLKNDRAPSGAGRYPVGIRFGGSRHIKYARQDVVDWMAHEELLHRMRRVHRCR